MAMRILLLAPHPFYQERGTPIAVDLLLRVLSRRGETVDVLTYAEGAGRIYPGVTIHRIAPLLFTRGTRPGFSPQEAGGRCANAATRTDHGTTHTL